MHEHKITIHTLNRKSLLLRYGAKNGFHFSLAAVNEDTLKQSKKRSIFSTKFAVSQASSPNLSIMPLKQILRESTKVHQLLFFKINTYLNS